jgi:hypothetical protein
MSEKEILYNQRKLFRKHLLAKKNLSVILNDAFCLAKMGVSNEKKNVTFMKLLKISTY